MQDMHSLPHPSAEDLTFYGYSWSLLEGVISEFLSGLSQMCRHRAFLDQRDPVAYCASRIKSAHSMKGKLHRLGLPETEQSALNDVFDAAGVRIICPFVEDIAVAAEMVRGFCGAQVVQEKDYISHPKPNGYRSYHMILRMPLRFTAETREMYLEIQIRTIAMDCWAQIEHSLKYKQDIAEAPMLIQELKRCADEIAATDLSLQTLREWIHSGIS